MNLWTDPISNSAKTASLETTFKVIKIKVKSQMLLVYLNEIVIDFLEKKGNLK